MPSAVVTVRPPHSPAQSAFGIDELVRRYLLAKRIVIEAGFEAEIAWQSSLCPHRVTEQSFLREAAWVVMSAGMAEAVVRRRFPLMRSALHDFEPKAIANDGTVRSAALSVLRHERKVDAILVIARRVFELGDATIRRKLSEDPWTLLTSLPYMGPATSKHLAKNLGLAVAKPDRHLICIARSAGRRDVATMCSEIAAWLDEPPQLVDLVLWRWAVLHKSQCRRTDCDGLTHLRPQDHIQSEDRPRFNGIPNQVSDPSRTI
jgi:hypothetical protein